MALKKGKIHPKSIVSTAASLAATAMVVRSIIPPELTKELLARFQSFLAPLSNNVTIIINEFDGLNKNKLFSSAELYMGTIAAPSAMTLRASLPEKEKKIHVSIGKDEDVADTFRGARLIWRLVTFTAQKSVRHSDDVLRTTPSEVRSLHLTFHKRHRRQVIDEYLPYVVEKSKGLREENKTLKLHTLGSGDGYYEPGMSPWRSVNLDHPSTFQTLALDDEVKSMIIEDLDRFVKRKDLYKKVGKAWKRGYLLFGPPGTGKSSLIAAMANYLKFDIYDLELTAVQNSSLRQLLIATANRSILVVEDIDATIDLSERKKSATPAIPHHPSYSPKPKVTLSGLLNFIDGLWTSCGDERIIIFTTNHKDKLDPALLRPGRMDLHIHMSYCTPRGFRLLVENYLGIEEHHHPLVTEAELLIGSTKVTPADVGEQLLKSDDPEIALKGLIVFLELKKQKKSKKVLEEKLEATIDIGVEGLKEVSTTEI